MSVPGKRWLWPVPLLFLLAFARPAKSQDLAAAEALFKKGVADLDAGRFETACPALAESHRLDPRPGTLFAVADCRDKQGRIATALALYEDYLRAVDQMATSLKLRHHDRAKIAKSRKEAIGPEIPELTLKLPEGAPSDVKVTRDGVVFSQATFGVALPIDPGEHVITVQTGSGAPREVRITLQKREKKTVVLELPATAPAPTATVAPKPVEAPPKPTTAATSTPAPTAPISTAQPASESTGLGGRKIAALAVGGVGLAGIGLGAAMGAIALEKKGVIDEHCPDRKCDAEGSKALKDAQVPGLVSTIGFGVGAAGVAAAVVLWLTAPSGAAPEKKSGAARATQLLSGMEIGPQGAVVRVQGRF